MEAQLEKFLEETVQADRRPDVYVMVMSGPEDGRIFPVTKESVTVGRLDTNEVALGLDPVVSRNHARVTREGDRHFIADLNSKFGTEVDGERVPAGGKKELRRESLIRVGETLLVFRAAAPAGN
jgi:pSer/pThr/pTyr-binding forkhead associated (FHA) protein